MLFCERRKAMKEIALQDIQGFRIGNAQDELGGTGCTVLIFPDGAPCGVDIRGGGPASRESELLNPTAAAERIHAVLLSGGSAFGLNAAGGVMQYLEEKGIGRPSTYAPIMDTIQNRNYVEKKDKQFIPTELGVIIVDLLKKYFERIINVGFTAHMEEELDDIEQGKDTYTHVLQEFYDVFKPEMDVAEQQMEKVAVAGQDSGQVCELCGAPMVYKFGRFGKFLACSNFPECRNTKAIVEDLGITCPKCGQGSLIKRKSKRGRVFYGCSEYPNCDFVLWNQPIDKKCPVCGSIMVVKHYKKGPDKIFCSNAECENHKKGEAINEE